MIIKLSCWFTKDVEKDSTGCVISIDNTECIESLREAIFNVGKKRNSNLSGLESNDLTLWKVSNCDVHDGAISKSTLQIEEENCECIQALDLSRPISFYWSEQPSENDLHVIVDSPLLALRNKNLEIQQNLLIVSETTNHEY